jgi:hypothetical protein
MTARADVVKKVLLWILSFLIAAGTMVYQRITGPTYPLRGRADVGGTAVAFKLPRSAEIVRDSEVSLSVPEASISGVLVFKRFKTDDPWTKIPMDRKGDVLTGLLPKQPRAGKLAYSVILAKGEASFSLPGDQPVVIRFRGAVPPWVLIPHVLAMLLAMMFAARAGIEALNKKNDPRPFAKGAAILLFVSGFILGPLMQSYGFGKLWTGFPLGTDLTDNKTLVAMIVWILALRAGRKGRPARGWVLAAAIVSFAVFLIPHSLLGSELDYSKLPKTK